MRELYGFMCLLIILLGLENADSNSFRCSSYCKESWNKFGYKNEFTYLYKYEGEIKTTISEAEAYTKVFIKSDVEISVISPCDYAIRLSNTQYKKIYKNKSEELFYQSDHHKVQNDLSKDYLYFSFQNGKIETVCPTNEDSNILQVKKGILSAFQNSMTNFNSDGVAYETDVSGICETRYSVKELNGNLIIKKTKNLDACTHRKSQNTSWSATPYSKGSPKSDYLLRSKQNCTQVINRDLILKSTECFETHLFKPFSNGDNGAITDLTQKLELVGTIDKIPTIKLANNYRYESLLSNFRNSAKHADYDLAVVTATLSDLEKNTIDGIESDVPKLFSRLIKELQFLNENEIIDLFEAVRELPRRKNFLLDAIPLVATPESIRAMRILYEKKVITESHVNAWISSLLLTTEVSLPIVTAVSPFMKFNNSIKQKAILSGSTLLYMYCKKDTDCFEKKEVQEITNIIQEPLNKGCLPNSFRNHQEILLALKGIGNIGFPKSINLLRRCFMNNDSPLEIRLAAIAAHRRINCAENDNLEQLLNYFGQINQNVEIRIASYLAVMQCSSYSTIAQVKDVLRHEETNQVGSFVWTHLTNLQESSSRWKQSIKSLVENEFLRNKFSTDVRKYSRNYEMSTFLDSINAGATVESNVIFTSESYLPKSLMLNFTLDLFGETVNILEVGVRMEGFEQAIENLFGPEGYFPEESIKNILESIKDKENQTHSYMKQFQNTFASRTTPRDPSALLYTKIFGNENFYTHFKDIEGFVNETVNERSILEKLIKLLSQQSVDYTKSFVFMDSNFKIPTLLGFPLELSVNGTTIFGLTLNEKINLKDFSIHKFSVEGKIYPSVAIEIMGSITIDCFDNKFGLTSVNTLNSNTYIDGHIFVNKGKLIDVKLNVPKQEMNIIRVKSQVYFINGEDASPMNRITDNIENWEGCTGKTFSNVTGLEVCYNMRYVNASAVKNASFFPLTGAFEYSMGIKKTDIFENYQFTLNTFADNGNFRPKYKISLNFDTPNSKVDRKIKTYYWLDCEKLSFDASLISPFLNYDIHTKIGDDYDNLAFLLQTKLNKKEIILVRVNLKSSKNGDTWTYEPLAMFKYKNLKMAELSGKVNYTEDVRYSADLKLESIFNDPIKVIGNLELGSKTMDLVGRIESNNLNGVVFAVITKNQEVVSVVANATYNFKDLKQEVLGVEFKQFALRKPSLNTDGLYISVNSTQKPLYDILFSVETHRSKLYFENKILLTLFEDFWETHQLFKFFRNNGNTDIALRCTLKGIKKNIDYIFNFLYLNLSNQFKFHILAQRNAIQRLETLIDYVIIPEEKRVFDLLLYYPQNTLAFNGLFNQINEQLYNFTVQGHYEYKKDKMPLVIFKGEYINSTIFQFENHTIAGTIQIYESKTSLCTPWIFSSSVQISPDLYLSISQLKINNKFYLLHTTWSSKSISALLQNNEKQIFALSYVRNANEFSLLVGLNIYQHFEVNLKLMTPYKKFDFLLYWDKSRDPNQKVSLAINSQVSKGLYMIKIEYPKQLITASFIILPVQVTMNVTWGLDSSKRIYLKAGNKIYDIGGLWFAKLETPFKYLESQEFKLSYYIIPYNAELKLDMNWSGTKVNLILSGMKTNENLSGYLDVNTTIPEISKVSIALSHLSNKIGGYTTIKNDATFVLNNHQVLSQSFWESNGANITANFEIISPSNIISPITGLLILSNNQSTKYLESYINWNNKIASVDYKFKNSESYVKIKTPIEGFEITEAVYTLIGEDKNIKLQVKLHILSQLNYALLSWDSKDQVNVILFEVISPMIGVYKMELQHSTVFGHFDELFIITQGIDNKILHLILQGELTPLLFLNVNAGVTFLEHKASAFIKNSENPLSSTVQLIWNESYITNILKLVQNGNSIENLSWNLNSSFLEENVTLIYTLKENLFLMSGNLHKNLKFNSSVKFENYYKLMEVIFNFNSEPETIALGYHHDLKENYFENQLLLHFNRNVTEFIFNYSINKTNSLMDQASLVILSPWNHELAINFSMPCENLSTVYPKILIKYMNSTVLNIKSKLQFEYPNNNLKFLINSKYIVPTIINFKSNLFNNRKSYNLVVKENSEENEILDLPGKEASTFLESSLNYNFVDFLKLLSLNVNFPKLYQKVQFDANLNTISQSGNFGFESTILNFEKVFANYSVKLTQNMNYVNLVKNDKILTINLMKENIIRNKNGFDAKLMVASNFEFIKNSSVEYIFKSGKKFKEIKIVALYDQYYGLLHGNYKFINSSESNDFFSLESKITSQLRHKNLTLVDVKGDLKGILKFESSNGEINILLNSNVENFEKLHSKLNYRISKRDNSARNLFLEPFSNKFDFLINFQASTLYDRVNGKIYLAKSENTVNTNIFLEKNVAVYNISMLTAYDSLLCTTTTIKFATPNKTYTGEIVSNFTLLNTKLILHGKFDNNNLNTFKLEIKSPSYNKMELLFLINFVNLDFTPWKINAKYDIAAKEKFIFFEGMNQNGAIVEAAVDMAKLSLKINYPNQINLITISGTHNLNTLNNISVIYNFGINKKFENYYYPTKIFYILKIKQFNSSFGLDSRSSSNDTVLNLHYHQQNTYSNWKLLKNLLNDFNFSLDLQNIVLQKLNFFLHFSQETNHNAVRIVQNSNPVLDFNLNRNNKEMFLKVDNSWKPFLLEYNFENFLNINGKFCWDLNHKNVSQLGGHIKIKENVSLEIILPTRILSLETNCVQNNFSTYYFGQFSWQENKKVVILLSKFNSTINSITSLNYEAKIDTPIRLIQAFYKTQENFQVSTSKKWRAAFQWNRDDNSKIYFQNYFIHGNLESKLFLPILKRDLILKINVNNQTVNFSNLKAELEYSDDAEKRITFEMYYDKELSDIFRSERKYILIHPASKIDYHLNVKTLGSPEFTTGNITFRYKNYLLDRPEEIKSSLTIGHKKFLISGYIRTNKNFVQFSSYTKSGKNFQKVFFLTQLDRKQPLTLEGNYIFKKTGSSLSFSTNCGHSRNYQFYVGYPSKREIAAHIIHNIFGKEGVDGKFTLKLNSTQIIWLKINWKNNWIAQFKDTILEDYYDLRYVVKEIGQQLIDVVDDHVCQTIAKDLSDLHNNVTDQIVRELDLLDQDYKHFTNYIKKGYQGNAFYCQDVINATKIILPNKGLNDFRVMQEFFDFIGLLHERLEDIKNNIFSSLKKFYENFYLEVENSVKKLQNVGELKQRGKQILKNGIDEARQSLKDMDELIDKIEDSVNRYIDNIKNECQEFLEPYLKLLDDFVIYVEQRLAILQMLVLDILDNVQHYILNLRESRELLKFYLTYINWLEEFHISDVLEPIADIIESVLDVIIKDAKNVMKDFLPYVVSISEALFGNYEEINKLFEVERCRTILNKIYSKTLWIWNYNNLSETIKNSLHKIIAGFDDYLTSLLTLDYDRNNFENILDQSEYVVRSDIGLIEITQPIPFEWEALDEMPHFNQVPLYDKLKHRFENLVKLERHHFADLINTIKKYIGEPSNTFLSPATNNIGMIVGKSHYITFDKKYYNFVGGCSYLLAGDLQTKSFSVVINYKTAINKSLSVITDDHNLEISSDFISLNNNNIDLPLVTESLIVTRENLKIVVNHNKGLKIICNLEYDFCMIELSGWLFGKTGGLLGTLDNEKITDMRLPGGNHTTDILKFVNSWHVDNCTDFNHVNTSIRKNISPLTVTLFETLCAVFFSNINSPSANCFNMVDPKPFYEMCVNNMKQSVNSTMCSTVAAYKLQCDRSNVYFPMPELCVFCKYGVGLNEIIFDRNSPTSVDVVFIKGSEYFGSDNELFTLPNKINENLEKRGFANNRFAVVGYDDKIGKPYVQTSGGQIWNYANQTIKLELKTQPKQKISAIDAIKYAVNMEFVPGVSKLFILLQCDLSSDDENLNSLHSTFGEKDVILHILCINSFNSQNQNLLESDNKGHVLNIQNGFDIQDSYVNSINATINVGISDQITDIYTLLALSTNGTVLTLNTEKENEMDKILSSWSQIISKTSYRSPCQKCKCVTNSDGIGVIECKRCMSPIVKQLLNEYESNIMEFYSDQDSDEYV